MSATIAFVSIAVVFLFVFVLLAVRRTRGLPDFDATMNAIRSLDIEAFRNLVDPNEEAFLRTSLPPQKFRTIHRERSRAALAYVKELSQASLQFARIGDAAQRNPDPVVAAWGKQVANSAIFLRLRALSTSVQLTLSDTFPGLPLRSWHPLLEQYDRATRLLLAQDAFQRAQGPS